MASLLADVSGNQQAWCSTCKLVTCTERRMGIPRCKRTEDMQTALVAVPVGIKEWMRDFE